PRWGDVSLLGRAPHTARPDSGTGGSAEREAPAGRLLRRPRTGQGPAPGSRGVRDRAAVIPARPGSGLRREAHAKAPAQVLARPTMSACMVAVPSKVWIASMSPMSRMTWFSTRAAPSLNRSEPGRRGVGDAHGVEADVGLPDRARGALA